ncbi:MAG: hypothetical protein GY915_01865, partial [bacterium]|nr:hypothetical protein [bacterium]
MKYLLLVVGVLYTLSVHAEIVEEWAKLSKSCPFGDSRGDVKRMLRTTSKLTPMTGKPSIDESDYYKHHFKKKKRTCVVPSSPIWIPKQLKKR